MVLAPVGLGGLHARRGEVQAWRAAQKALAEARSAQESLQRERERLAWQIGEVDKLAPGTDEWDDLNASHTRLANAQGLMDAAQATLAALEGWLTASGPQPDWPGLDAIAPARDFPGRHGAMLLPWRAALEALPTA